MKKILNFIVKCVVSLGLMLWLLSMIDWHTFLVVIVNSNLWLISLCIPFFLINNWFSILRWAIALKYYQIKENQKSLYNLYLEGAFFNNFLPSSIGGDGYKYLTLSKKHSSKKREVIASMIFDRGIGFAALFVVNIILSLCYLKLVTSSDQFIVLEAVIFSVAILVVLTYCFRDFFRNLFTKIKLKNKIIGKIFEVSVVFVSLGKTELIRPAIIYSFFFIVIGGLWQWVFLLAFGVHVNFIIVLLIFTVIQIMGAIPLTLNSIGISEGLAVLLYGLAGAKPEVALAVALVSRISLMLLSSIGMFMYLNLSVRGSARGDCSALRGHD